MTNLEISLIISLIYMCGAYFSAIAGLGMLTYRANNEDVVKYDEYFNRTLIWPLWLIYMLLAFILRPLKRFWKSL